MSTTQTSNVASFYSTAHYDLDDPVAPDGRGPSGAPSKARGKLAQGGGSPHGEQRKASQQFSRSARTSGSMAPASGAAPMTAAQFATTMLDKYDGGARARDHSAESKNAQVIQESTKLSMTGLPPSETEMTLDELQFADSLSQMDEEKREAFAKRADALRALPDEQYGAMLLSLVKDVRDEVNQIQADPVRRMLAIFNAPTGLAALGDAGTKLLGALRDEFKNMMAHDATPAQREQAFASASRIKSKMQDGILGKCQDALAVDRKAWSESAARVNRILDDAEKYTADTIRLPHNSDDPQWDDTRRQAYAKTFPYQSVIEKVLSVDGYSTQERNVLTPTLPPEERVRDLLTFQQGMSDPGSDVSRRMAKLEQQASSTMTNPGPDLDAVKPPASLSSVGLHPPADDRDYAANLAGRYTDALKDIDLQNRTMLRSHIPGVADKIEYGIGRFIADQTPVPGFDWLLTALLDARIPERGGLSSQQVRYIDMGATVFGLLSGKLGVDGEGSMKPPTWAASDLHARPPASLPENVVPDFERLFARPVAAA